MTDEFLTDGEPFPDAASETGRTQIRKILEKRQNELRDLQTMSEAARDTVALDQQSVGRLSRMDAMQQQAMAQANERQRLGELHRIDRALTRLKEGEFGLCEVCDDAIPAKRLAFDPSVATCVRCAR